MAQGSPHELVSSLPYRYKVVVRGPPPPVGRPTLRLGDRTVIYCRTSGEARDVASSLDYDSPVSVERVDLEDVYLNLVVG